MLIRFRYDFTLPRIMSEPKVMVRTYPNDELEGIDNPLFSFKIPHPKEGDITEEDFNSLETGFNDGRPQPGTPAQDGESAWRSVYSREHTVRFPKPENTNQGSAYNMSDSINKAREQSLELLINMLSDHAYDKYSVFSNDSAQEGAYGSIESLHND